MSVSFPDRNYCRCVSMSLKCNLSSSYGPAANKRAFTLILAEHSVHPGNPCLYNARWGETVDWWWRTNPVRGDNLAVYVQTSRGVGIHKSMFFATIPIYICYIVIIYLLYICYMCRYTNNNLTWSCSLWLSVIRKSSRQGSELHPYGAACLLKKEMFYFFPFSVSKMIVFNSQFAVIEIFVCEVLKLPQNPLSIWSFR